MTPSASEELVTVRDVPIRIETAGTGPSVLFLHGMSGARWTPGLRALADRFTVVMPEHPGFGLAAQQPQLRTAQDLAILYMDLVHQEGLADAALVGHSFGGWIASELAVRAPVPRLALVSPMGTRIPGEDREDVFYRPVPEVLDLVYEDRSLAPTDGESKEDYRNVNALARYGWNPYLARPTLAGELHLVMCPTLVVWGRDDRVVPATHAGIYASEIDGATTVMIEDAGHDPFTDQPERTAAALADFLTPDRMAQEQTPSDQIGAA